MKKTRKFSVIHGRAQKRKGEKIYYAILIIVAVLLGAQTLYSFAHDFVAARFVRTVISEDAVLENKVVVKGVIVRDERVVAAPITGKLNWVAQEEERLAVQMPVAVLTSSDNTSVKVKTPVSGVVVLSLDGLEGEFQPKSLAELNVSAALKLQPKTRQLSDGELVQQGSVLFKVTDNFNWYFVTEVQAGIFNGTEPSANQLIRFSFAPGQDIMGRLNSYSAQEDTVAISFEVKDYLPGCFTERFAEAELILKRTRGVILPHSALVERGEDVGVYTLEKSVVRYRSIDVLEFDEHQVLVEGLRTGLPVITNPGLVREGQRL